MGRKRVCLKIAKLEESSKDGAQDASRCRSQSAVARGVIGSGGWLSRCCRLGAFARSLSASIFIIAVVFFVLLLWATGASKLGWIKGRRRSAQVRIVSAILSIHLKHTNFAVIGVGGKSHEVIHPITERVGHTLGVLQVVTDAHTHLRKTETQRCADNSNRFVIDHTAVGCMLFKDEVQCVDIGVDDNLTVAICQALESPP